MIVGKEKYGYILLAIIVAFTTGCPARVKKDYIPEIVTKKGYVDFSLQVIPDDRIITVPIYQNIKDEQKRVGEVCNRPFKTGEYLSNFLVGVLTSTHGGTGTGSTTNLHLAAKHGRETFFIGGGKVRVNVDIRENMVTPVKIVLSNPQYKDQSTTRYKVSYQVEKPIPFEEEKQ